MILSSQIETLSKPVFLSPRGSLATTSIVQTRTDTKIRSIKMLQLWSRTLIPADAPLTATIETALLEDKAKKGYLW
jgi:hypothetical protein